MRKFIAALCLGAPLVISLLAQSNSFVGRWDFDVQTPRGHGANWLGVAQTNGQLEVWFQPTGGHVFQIKDPKVEGNRLSFVAADATATRPASTWELTASGDKLIGTEQTGANTIPLKGVRAPALKRSEPRAWGAVESLFDGKDLNGWTPIGNVAANHWTVQDGMLVNQEHGANLKSDREFTDFKVHFEVNCPDGGNSGFYLRGRYEMQIAYEATEPPNRSMGAIYGRLAPAVELPRRPGDWDSFDITLVGRIVTIVRNGTTTVDHKEIEGITGGALDADEGNPGPFYIQGDHTGGLKFRNITVSVPKS